MIQTLERVRGPVCGVFSVALMTSISFGDVFDHAKTILKKTRQWRGGLKVSELVRLLDSLSIKYLPVEGYRGKTLRGMAAEVDPSKCYLVLVTRHFLTLYQGKCYDQSHPGGISLNEYAKAKCQIKSVLRIVK